MLGVKVHSRVSHYSFFTLCLLMFSSRCRNYSAYSLCHFTVRAYGDFDFYLTGEVYLYGLNKETSTLFSTNY